MKAIVLFSFFLLVGCGPLQYKAAYNESLSAYKQCVQANGPDACRKEKAILDADAQRYRDVDGGSAVDTNPRPTVYQPVGGGTVIRY